MLQQRLDRCRSALTGVALSLSRCFAEACNTDTCPARQKWCPGTALSFNDTSQSEELSECSGNGVCLRDPSGCTEDSPLCRVACLCDASSDWAGAACSATKEQLLEKQAVRNDLLAVLVRRWGVVGAWPASVRRSRGRMLWNVLPCVVLCPRVSGCGLPLWDSLGMRVEFCGVDGRCDIVFGDGLALLSGCRRRRSSRLT